MMVADYSCEKKPIKEGSIAMKARVHYVSPKGAAETIAETIARECKCVKEPLLPAYMPENVAIMFLGCEGNKADKTTLEFINSLNKNRVANAALYCCNPKKNTAPIAQMKAALEAQGVKVMNQTYVCTSKGLFGGKNPGDAECNEARQFAQSVIKELFPDA